MPIHITPLNNKQLEALHIQCSSCSGLCCVALFISKVDGFPIDKPAGIPCQHLQKDYFCDIHEKLACRHMNACLSFDCLGAGQLTTQVYQNTTWRSHPEHSDKIYQTFFHVYQLQHIAWYLLEASTLSLPKTYLMQIASMQRIYEKHLASLLQLTSTAIDTFRDTVNPLLKEIIRYQQKPYPTIHKNDHQYIGKNLKGKDLRGMDFTMSLCIAANFEDSQLEGACFLGADMRDVNVCNTDLSNTLFLTQAQINSMHGNTNTIVGPMLKIPSHWK